MPPSMEYGARSFIFPHKDFYLIAFCWHGYTHLPQIFLLLFLKTNMLQPDSD
jgi:hypothetical protein